MADEKEDGERQNLQGLAFHKPAAPHQTMHPRPQPFEHSPPLGLVLAGFSEGLGEAKDVESASTATPTTGGFRLRRQPVIGVTGSSGYPEGKEQLGWSDAKLARLEIVKMPLQCFTS